MPSSSCAMLSGKFHGVIRAATPIGSRKVMHHAVPVDRDRRPVELVDRAGVVPHHGGGVADAPARVADRHAHVAGLEQRRARRRAPRAGRPSDRAPSRAGWPSASPSPRRRGPRRGLRGRRPPARRRDRAEHLAGRGIDGVERRPLGGRHPLAVDHEALERRGGHHGSPLTSCTAPSVSIRARPCQRTDPDRADQIAGTAPDSTGAFTSAVSRGWRPIRPAASTPKPMPVSTSATPTTMPNSASCSAM